MKGFIQYKKSILTGIGFLFFGMLRAQSPENAMLHFQQQDMPRAKAAIDSFTQAYPANAAGWLLKASICHRIASTPQWQDLLPDGYTDALDALFKADQINVALTDSVIKAGGEGLPNQLYNSLSEKGIATFNTAIDQQSRQGFKNAYTLFRNAGRLSGWIHEKGGAMPAIDTANLFYITTAAIHADDEFNALLLAQKTAQYQIKTDRNNLHWEFIYQWLVYHYRKQNDAPHFLQYAALGKMLFPSSDYFTLSEIDWYRQQGKSAEQMAAYQQLFSNFGKKDAYILAYCSDCFNWLDSIGVKQKPAQHDSASAALINELNRYINNNPGSTAAKLLLAKTYLKRYRSAAPSAIKSKSALLMQKAQLQAKEIVTQFPSATKAERQEALQMLIAIHTQWHQTGEVKHYKALLEALK